MSYDKFINTASAVNEKVASVEAKLKALDDSKTYAVLEEFSVCKPGDTIPQDSELIYAFQARLICAIVGGGSTNPVEALVQRVKALGGNALLNLRTELGHVVAVPALLAVRDLHAQTSRKQLRENFKKNEILVVDELKSLIDETNRLSAVNNEHLIDAYDTGFARGKMCRKRNHYY